MASRLDRLVALLDSGATPLVRATAARQIGGIQKQHPEELFRLLARVYEYVGSKSWDTRVAASQAVEAIIKEVSDWDPNGDEQDAAGNGNIVVVKKEEDISMDDDSDMLTFAQFNVDSVIKHGRLLLGSAGREYDDDEAMAGLDPQQRIAAQRAQMRKRLGIGAQFLDEDLLDDVDLGADDLAAVGSNRSNKLRGRKRKSDPSSPQLQPSPPCKREAPSPVEESSGAPDIDMSKLSARERNRLKRKARIGGKKKAKVDLGPKKSNGNGNSTAQSSDPETPPGPILSKSGAVDVTEQPGGDSIVVESKRADTREALFAISEGTWAFESLVEVLCIDLFDPSWEVRHGAGMALREIFKHHGHCAGRVAGTSVVENSRRNQRFLEDVCVRLMCVFTLDRFGDFVSDHVVAPVRETCAQTMGVVSQFLTQPLLVATQQALLQLIARGAGSTSSAEEEGGATVSPIWEARHSGLSGLRYIVAVRRDMAPLLVMGTLDAALAGLRDHDDDVRSVSAEALLPLVDTMVTCQPTRILDVINGVWAALTDLGDDLTASVASIMELLARLFSHPQVRAAVIEAGRHAPERYAFPVLIPQLYPFFRHTIASVRKATVQSLLTFASMQEATRTGEGENEASALVPSPSLLQNTTTNTTITNGQSGDTVLSASSAEAVPWADTACLRLVFQNLVLETNTEILELSAKLWEALLRQCCSAEGKENDKEGGCVQKLLPPNVISAMFRLASTPIGVPLPQRLLYDSRCTSTSAAETTTIPISAAGTLVSSRYNVDKPMIQQDRGLISRETIMRCRVQAAAALGLLAAAWPISSRAETLDSILTDALRSGWSLQCQLASVVIEEMVMAERTGLFAGSALCEANNSGYPMNTGTATQLESSEFVDHLRDTVTGVLNGTGELLPRSMVKRGIAYYDMQRSLAHIHANCQVLYDTFRNDAKIPDAAIPILPPLDSTMSSQNAGSVEEIFTLVTAEHLCSDDEFNRLLGQVSARVLTARVRSTLLERRQRVRASIEYYQQLQQQLDVSTNAALAGALVGIGKLPAKLNAVLRAIMAAIKLEPSELLQTRAAQAVARLAALCYCAEENTTPRKGPADKMVRNLATFVCSDPWTTPVFAQRASQEESILMLEM
ncbi:TATA-binding protein-associated factor mot1, partial [Coemansia sp. RSA 1843]